MLKWNDETKFTFNDFWSQSHALSVREQWTAKLVELYNFREAYPCEYENLYCHEVSVSQLHDFLVVYIVKVFVVEEMTATRTAGCNPFPHEGLRICHSWWIVLERYSI